MPVRSPWEKPLLAVAFALALLLGLAAAASFIFLLSRPSLASALSTLPSNPWWLVYRDPSPENGTQAMGVVAGTLGTAVAGGVASIGAYRLHRRSLTPVFPYLLLFFLSLTTECIRGATASLYISEHLISTAFVLTRIVYWGRYVGLFALLLASLSCIDMKYRRASVLGGAALLVALIIAASIPLDRSTFLSQFTWKLGDEEGVWFTNLVIAALIVLTTVGASVIKKDRRFLVVAGGFLLILAARELLFFSVLPLLLGGAIAGLAAGAVVCLRTLSGISREK